MALAEICGMQDFDAFRSEYFNQNDVFKFTKNLDCHTELAVPPFPNVSQLFVASRIGLNFYGCLIAG